jgi:thioredoxin reductase (NADPH)
MIYSTIIIGSGPAGHTSAIYLARANLSPLLLEGDSSGLVPSGGLLTTTKTVENYPGFVEGIDGFELTQNFKDQSEKYGTKIISENATKIEKYNDNFIVYTPNNKYETKTIIIATGSTPKRLYVKGYDDYWHKGISTCAVCDGSLPCYRNIPIAVVGGGDSACEEALHLTHTASIVYLIHRRDVLRASKIMNDRVLSHSKIKMIWNSEVVEINGSDRIEQLKLKNNLTNCESYLDIGGLFVAIGHTPNTDFISNFIKCDDDGYIVTDRDMSTSVEGIWAVGDVQDRKYKQAITAAGFGCIGALEVERYLQLKDN